MIRGWFDDLHWKNTKKPQTNLLRFFIWWFFNTIFDSSWFFDIRSPKEDDLFIISKSCHLFVRLEKSRLKYTEELLIETLCIKRPMKSDFTSGMELELQGDATETKLFYLSSYIQLSLSILKSLWKMLNSYKNYLSIFTRLISLPNKF